MEIYIEIYLITGRTDLANKCCLPASPGMIQAWVELRSLRLNEDALHPNVENMIGR